MKNKLVFWNVDTQHDFIRPDGKLYVQDAEKIEVNLEMLTKYAKEKKIKVINTADWHDEDSKELDENPNFVNTFPKHCMANTIGAEFVPATNPNPKETYFIDWKQKSKTINEKIDENLIAQKRNIVLYKDAFNIFEGNKFADDVVKTLNFEEVLVYGVATNVCVDFAVMGLLERQKQVYVAIDAIKELPNLPLDVVLNKWKENGAKLIQVTDLKYL